MKLKPIEWASHAETGSVLRILDQTQLPEWVVAEEFTDWRDVAEAIRAMKVRGAPAIGIAAAYGIALAAHHFRGDNWSEFLASMEEVCQEFARTRPTAVNLFWAIERMQRVLNTCQSVAEARERLLQEAHQILQEDYEADRRLAEYGALLLPPQARVMTLCNTGALATGGIGTALGIIRVAWLQGRLAKAYVCETRPRLQGLRLTTWELLQEGIPFQLITDNMAGWLMAQGKVEAVIVGADRIATNGDTANKIGTYTLAVLAHHHHIPFYVAAPCSTIDLSTPNGKAIPVEHRDATEVTHIGNLRIAPQGTPVLNPAFDITPATLITAIITERGVAQPPYESSLRELCSKAH